MRGFVCFTSKIVKMYSIKEVNSNIQNLRTVEQDNFAVNVCKSL